MSGVSIQITGLNTSWSSVSSSQLYPPHRKKIESALRKIFNGHIGNIPVQKGEIRLRLQPGNPTLKVGDCPEVSLSESAALQDVNRVIRYYQNTGHLQKPRLAPNEEKARIRESKKSVRAIHETGVPGNNGSLLAGARLADDTLSLTKHIMNMFPAFGPKDSIAKHLGYYAGIFWAFFALRELDDGIREQKRSQEIGDAEGLPRARARLLSGTIVATGSLAYLASKVNDTVGFHSVSSALLNASNVLFGTGSLLAIGSAVSGVLRCNRFAKRLNEYLHNPSITETERMRGAIQFLKDSLSVTAEEKEAFALQIERAHPDWTLELKEQYLSQKLADLTEVKVRYLKRRTSNKSLRLIIEQSDQILKKLNDPRLHFEGVRDAIFLIHIIQKENKIKTTLYFLGLIAASLSFIAMLVTVFAAASVLPFVLYGIAGTIYLGITIYSVLGLLLQNRDLSKLDSAPVNNRQDKHIGGKS